MPSIFVLLAVSALGLALAPPLAAERPAGERPSGSLVFLSRGNQLTSVDLGSGRRTVRRVPGVATCAPELQVTGGHVVFAGYRRQTTVVFSVPVALDRPPRLLGPAHQFVRSTTEGRVWLVGTDCDQSQMKGVKEVSVDGQVTASSDRRIPSTWLAGATEQGLVLQRRRALFVWDPLSGRRTGLGLDAVSDVSGPAVAGCASRCRRLAILDDDGRRTIAHAKAPTRLDAGARFSPDGQLLAAPAVARKRWHVELVDPRTGSSRPIRGSATGDTYPDLRWSASSGWLFFRSGHDRLKAYRPGADKAITLPLRWPRKAVSYVAG
jgi:hypothetical protein